MGTLQQKIAHLKHYSIQVQEAKLLRILKNDESVILDMNTSQLFAGYDSLGRSLGEYHSRAYAAFKRHLNPAGVVDLKLTGDFYDGFYLDASHFPVRIDSKDSKTGKLTGTYSENIFGLTQKNQSAYNADYLKEEYRQYWRTDILAI